MTKFKTDTVVELIVGALVIFYLVANVWNDASDELATVNESSKGGKLITLLPIFLAIAILIMMVRVATKSK